MTPALLPSEKIKHHRRLFATGCGIENVDGLGEQKSEPQSIVVASFVHDEQVSLSTGGPRIPTILRYRLVSLHLCGSGSTYDMFFEALPDDLIAVILGELDLDSLITISHLSKRFHTVASEPSLNPWRKPILRNLRTNIYEPALQHLSVRSIVPRQNWIDILILARPSFILYEATLPNLKAVEWEECFRRRFLPGWQKWRKGSPWKEAFLRSVDCFPLSPSAKEPSIGVSRVLHRVWHRSVTTCTTDESWTKSAFYCQFDSSFLIS